MIQQLRVCTVLLLGTAVAACATQSPPTITPAIEPAAPTGASVIDIPLGTPGEGGPANPLADQPVSITEMLPYRDPGGAFAIDVPVGWAETRQPTAEPGSDVILGVVFQPVAQNGLLTVTQFDNGQMPDSLGTTANSVLELTGWRDQPGYRELARETSVERPGEAMRLEIEYQRKNGIRMHSLVLFQIDGTTFSMVNVAVVAGSWVDNEGAIRDVLTSYKVPAPAGG